MEHVLSAFHRTDEADDELKAAMADEGASGAAARVQAAVEEYELLWALRGMVEQEHIG